MPSLKILIYLIVLFSEENSLPKKCGYVHLKKELVYTLTVLSYFAKQLNCFLCSLKHVLIHLKTRTKGYVVSL